MAASVGPPQRIALYIVDSSVPRSEADLVEKAISITVQGSSTSAVRTRLPLAKYSIEVKKVVDPNKKYAIRRLHFTSRKKYNAEEDTGQDTVKVPSTPTNVLSRSSTGQKSRQDVTRTATSSQDTLVESLLKNINGKSSINCDQPTPFKLNCSLCAFVAKTVQQFQHHISEHAALNTDATETNSVSLGNSNLDTIGSSSSGSPGRKRVKPRIPKKKMPLLFEKTPYADNAEKDFATGGLSAGAAVAVRGDGNVLVQGAHCQSVIDRVANAGHLGVQSLSNDTAALKVPEHSAGTEANCRTPLKTNINVTRKRMKRERSCVYCSEAFVDDVEVMEHICNIHNELPYSRNEIKCQQSPKVKPCPRRFKSKLANPMGTIKYHPIVVTDSEAEADEMSELPNQQGNSSRTKGDQEILDKSINEKSPKRHKVVRRNLQVARSPMRSNNSTGKVEQKSPKSPKYITQYYPVTKPHKSLKSSNCRMHFFSVNKLQISLESTEDDALYFPVIKKHRCTHCQSRFVQKKHLKQHISLLHENSAGVAPS